MKTHNIKTPEQVKEDFSKKGISISAWAKKNGFSREYVHTILSGKRKCNIGKSHNIAVLLGIKEGEIVDYKTRDSETNLSRVLTRVL